jgi:hypothetical protein
MSQIPSVPPIVNRGMKLVLRSPMHGMVSNIFTLSFSKLDFYHELVLRMFIIVYNVACIS